MREPTPIEKEKELQKMRLTRFAAHLGWALVALAAMLVILWFFLNLVATRAPSPVSSLAQSTANYASGSAYGF